MKKILITGSHSLLGLGLIKTKPNNIHVFPTVHRKINASQIQLDVTDKKNVKSVFQTIQPDFVIHSASISDVDYCEKNKKEARSVNIRGTKNIIEQCKIYKSKIIFISSNALFDGNKDTYKESDIPHPLNYYGKTKLIGENLVKESTIPFVIARLMTMYGWQPKGARPNPVTWLLKKLRNTKKVIIVNDVYLNPLYNLDAAKIIWKLIEKNKQGIYHVAGNQKINRFDWMKKTAIIFGQNKELIAPVLSNYFENKIAKRPLQTVFSIEKTKKELQITPKNISLGLNHMKKTK